MKSWKEKNREYFDFFDKIVCICGENEKSRWKSCKITFDNLGIADRVERFSDFATEEQKMQYNMDGCTYSHYQVIKNAQKYNCKNVLIFESDVHFINYEFHLLEKSIKKLMTLDWKLFYLGGNPTRIFHIESENLIKASVKLAHAYVVNGKYFSEILNKIEKTNRIVDQVYRRCGYGIGNYSYISYPLFAIQQDSGHERAISRRMGKKWSQHIKPMMGDYIKNVKEANE